MATLNEEIRLFFKEATQELLHNILHHKRDGFGQIGYRKLNEEFEGKLGKHLMDFLGLGNITDKGWFEFLQNSSSGLVLDEKNISIDEQNRSVHENYNSSNMPIFTDEAPPMSIAEYREILLIQACKLFATNDVANVKTCRDRFGSTPLHLVAAMPGLADHEPTLLRYLLKAGLDPVQENNEGLTILHIIAGRIKAKQRENGDLFFESECIDEISWDINHRKGLLNLLFEELSPTQLSTLMSKLGRNGNTVMHEWVLSTSSIQLLKTTTGHQLRDESSLIANEIELASILLSFGGNLRIPNRSGLVPLHYACNSAVFQFLLQNGAVCRSRSDQDETPLLYLLKFLVVKIREFHLEKNLRRSVEEAVLVSQHLIKLFDESEEVRKTVWIPDIEETSPLEIVLVCVRISSYYFNDSAEWLNSFLGELRNNLVQFLEGILRIENQGSLRCLNKKGQGPLHVLLDMGSSDENTIDVDSAILQSLELLLQSGANVKAVDGEGKTALNVAYKFIDKVPSLYKKCASLLQQNMAKFSLENHSGATVGTATVVSNQPQASSTLHGSNATRKLRACPPKHHHTALQLTQARRDVTVVQKYRYFSQTPIGSGAFSSIYVAIKDEHVDTTSGTIECRVIALKRLEKAKINPQEVQREVQALLSFSTSCENILNCYDSFEDEFFNYLCLELMDGDIQQFIEDSTMKSLMQKNSPTPVQATHDIVDGLSYLHERDFLHRDLKPGNILYITDPSLRFKIGDFGLAKNISSCSTMMATKDGGVAMAPGTRCWMAPELVSLQSREHTKKSDVFALGLVLHYLLSLGKHPFVGETDAPAHVIEKSIVDMIISIDASLSNEAEHFIRVLLIKNPSQRPPAKYLKHHPFLWSEKKKIELLKAVGDQPEAYNPGTHPNSVLEQSLQRTATGQQFKYYPWDQRLPELFSEMTRAWRAKKYRTNYVIDLIRFIRNAYAHKEERSPNLKVDLDNNIFLTKFPSLVLDVFTVVQAAGYNENRSNIREAISLS